MYTYVEVYMYMYICMWPCSSEALRSTHHGKDNMHNMYLVRQDHSFLCVLVITPIESHVKSFRNLQKKNFWLSTST